MPIDPEVYSYGSLPELYVEYAKRSKAFTMNDDHYHDYYEIYYMLSGKRIYFIRDRSYSVEQGDLVFINKHELHKTMHTGEASHERVIVHFDDAMVNRLSNGHAAFLLSPFQQQSHMIRLPRKEQLEVEQIIKRMIAEMQRKPTGYELYPSILITELLLSAARFLEQNGSMVLHQATPMHAKITEIVRYINAHYDKPLRLNSLSEQFFISPYYLSRIFKEITGFSFSDYVVLTRIKEAQRLLRESDMNITDVAAAAGFDNFSHFGKTFKKKTQLSPRDYRKQYL